MRLESIKIKIIRMGFNGNPSYSFTVYGYGKLSYIGFENVKVLGERQVTVDDEKIIDILSNLKNTSFFTIDKNRFQLDDLSKKSYTTITIEMLSDDNVPKSKSISFYDDDDSAPHDIKDFVKKTEIILGIRGFTEIPVEAKKPAVKLIRPAKKGLHGKNLRIVTSIAVLLIIASSIFVFYYTGFFDPKESINNDNNGNSMENKTEIVFIEPTSSSLRFLGSRSAINRIFNQGDTVYIDCEINNVTHDNIYDFQVEIQVSDGLAVYYENLTLHQDDASEFSYFIHGIKTDGSWPGDTRYDVEVKVFDKIQNIQFEGNTWFRLIEENEVIDITVELSSDVVNGYAPLNVIFSATTSNFTGSDLSYTWDTNVEQITTSTPSLSYVFDEAGYHIITLTVKDEFGFSKKDSTSIYVYEQSSSDIVTAYFTHDSSSTYDYTFTAAPTGGTEPYGYEWDFDYDFITFDKDAEGKEVSWTFESSGGYFIILKVTDSKGKNDTYSDFLSIN